MNTTEISKILQSHAVVGDLSLSEIETVKSLLLEGVIDSLGLLSVVTDIEKSIGQSLPPHLITMERFQSVDTIAGAVSEALAA